MPLYEYRCASCNKTHEVMQKFSDPPLGLCPDCGEPVEKLMSRSSFALKGGGWYTTDYKKSSKPAETGEKAAAESGDKATAGGDAKATGDAKAASATPAKAESTGKSEGSKSESKPAMAAPPKAESKPVSKK